MSDKIYEVPAEWKSRAFIDDAKYQAMFARFWVSVYAGRPSSSQRSSPGCNAFVPRPRP